MIKVYIKLHRHAHLPILYPNLGFIDKPKSLFINEAFKHYSEPVFSIVKDPAAADYFLIPHEFFLSENDAPYLEEYAALARRYGKKILVFTHTDYDRQIKLPDTIVFRISQYGYKKKANEIIMPPYAEDLLGTAPLMVRRKQDRAVIGFCGWANLASRRDKVGYYFNLATSVFKRKARRSGIWFRQKAIKILQQSSLVQTNFLIRDGFSGHRFTIKLDPVVARREYIDNMLNSDLALAVKGGGNNSLRFYEALSLGRIPLLINTDCLLPLSDVIEYKQFVLFVDFTELDRIDIIASDFYKKLSDDDFARKQRRAREVFEKYLRVDSFFKQIPDILKSLS